MKFYITANYHDVKNMLKALLNVSDNTFNRETKYTEIDPLLFPCND